MRRLTLVCAITVLAAPVCLAQGESQQSFKLSGTVLNAATGEPVPNALVQVNGSNQFRSTTSAHDGHFEFTGIPAGRAYVSGSRPGFYADPSKMLAFAVNADVTGLSVKVSPLSKITGRLLDRDGEPIEGVQMLCVRSMVQMGRKQDTPTGNATTDEQGSFTIVDLQPGSYYLFTQTIPLYPGASAKTEASRYIYPQTFYPGAESRESAQAINVASDSEMRADMTLHSARGIRVRTSTMPHYRFMMVNMARDEGTFPINGQFDEEQQVWTFSGVTPGTWKVTAFGPFGPEQKGQNGQLYGDAEFQAGTQDIDNLTIPLNKLTNVHATLSGELKSGVQLTMRSSSGEMNATHVDSTGPAQIPDVKPGSYTVTIEAFGGCISSVSAGSQDLLREPLVIQPDAIVPTIQINSGSDCADLTLTTAQGATGMAVVLKAGDGLFSREVSIGPQGTSLKGLRAGEYNVFAFASLEGLEYHNAEVMRSYKGKSITLGPGQKSSLQVEVNEKRE